ncbi:hypothetical protein PanWU01x14_323050 [Parasponia andersonii]|uniref:Uncharacterized protein n=1 Tax=Parasponia andersonii TaxID=3476 RepID=A0A2P5AKN9_PARAD|nr:hypothetical protein PanWU01x14_323050 [Parasponia andersonii]
MNQSLLFAPKGTKVKKLKYYDEVEIVLQKPHLSELKTTRFTFIGSTFMCWPKVLGIMTRRFGQEEIQLN